MVSKQGVPSLNDEHLMGRGEYVQWLPLHMEGFGQEQGHYLKTYSLHPWKHGANAAQGGLQGRSSHHTGFSDEVPNIDCLDLGS